MSALDRLIPTPRLLQVDRVDLTAPPERVWERVRHGELGASPITNALFALRTLPARVRGEAAEPLLLHLDDFRSTSEKPGFQILFDDPPREVAVGAIGKVWQLDIPFEHVGSAAEFAAFARPEFIKVAWSLRLSARGDHDTRVELELRVDATDDAAWKKFRPYFALIGPFSHLIRRILLGSLERELGTAAARAEERPLAGDDLLPDAVAQLTDFIDIAATPERIWPWLVQMGCHRAGFYSADALDNGNVPSAREIHPELQDIRVGDVLPATPDSDDGFEVLQIVPDRALVLGGLFDVASSKQLPFTAARPDRHWQVTWAFVLEPLDATSTRLHVRARGAFPRSERFHAAWIRPVHSFMEHAQLRHLKARVEGHMARDGAREILAGVGGAAAMMVAFLTPFLRGARSHWGIDEKGAARTLPGDGLVPIPRWAWTHAVEIDAPADEVWPWIAQIGADRGGFYSHQWLENVIGCNVRNAETVHPEWAHRVGDNLSLHPDGPPMPVVDVVPGHHLVAYGAPDADARAAGRPWIAASWLFFVEPLGPRRCRFISRFRSDCSDDLATRLTNGPLLLEPVSFVMDRAMLLGVKERAERLVREVRHHHVSNPAF